MAESIEVSIDLVVEGLGAFDEIEKIGKGSFGTTFRVVRSDEQYALKVIHCPGLPEFLWQREVESLRMVEHPNVVGLRGVGEFPSRGQSFQFLECEFIEGGTLETAANQERRPEGPADLRGFLSGLLAGVAEIHDLGVIHRDLKPANIALRDGSWSAPVILDFGLAKVLSMSTHTIYPAHVGTVNYMAPEQLRGAPARTRSDMFSVGVVTYELGTGNHPFFTEETSSVQSLYECIMNEAPEHPRRCDLFDDVTADIVARLLSPQGYQRMSANGALRRLES